MSRRGKSGLTSDDRTLWQKVARTTRPMHPGRPVLPGSHAPSKPRTTETAQTEPPPTPIAPFRLGQTAISPPQTGKSADPKPSPIDQKLLNNLRRGKLKPQARIDLHGMTQDHALPELTQFIMNSSSRGLRLVLVITGKGRPRPDFGPIPEQPGVLRRNVPIWLQTGLLGTFVMDVVEAHRTHGGTGAYYVYLRTRRQ